MRLITSLARQSVDVLRRINVGPRLLIFFALLSIGPLFVTVLITGNIASRSSERAIRDQAQGAISQAANSISSQLGELERKAVRISYSAPVQAVFNGEPTSRELIATVIGDEFYLTNYLAGVSVKPEGQQWENMFGESAMLNQIFANDRPIQQLLANQGDRSVFTAQREEIEHEYQNFITLWRPVYSEVDQQRLGLLALTVHESYVSSLARQINSVPGSRAVIASTSNASIVSNVGTSWFPVGDQNDVVREVLEGKSESEVEGTKFLVVSSPIDNSDLVAMLFLPLDYIYASKRETTIAFFTIGAFGAGIALLIGALLAHTVNSPIRRLTNKIESLEKKPTGSLKVDEAKDEIGRLDRRFNELIEQNRSHAIQREQSVTEKHRLELAMLQSQVNPHFLANVLGSIHQLAALGNSAAIIKLSDALAGTVNRTFRAPGGERTLTEEYESVEDYALIDSYRRANAILLELDLPKDLAGISVPGFILQPIVENSFLHGFEDFPGVGRVWITSRLKEPGRICIEVSDNGKGTVVGESRELLGKKPAALTGFGLYSVRERLRLLYADEASFEVESNPWIRTTVRITFPIESEVARGEN